MTDTPLRKTYVWWSGPLFFLLYWISQAGIALVTQGPVVGVTLDGLKWALVWSLVVQGGLTSSAWLMQQGRLSRDSAEIYAVLTALALGSLIYAEWRGLPQAFVVSEKLVLVLTVFPFALGVVLMPLLRPQRWIRTMAACACMTVALYVAQVMLPKVPLFLHSGAPLSRAAPQPTATEYASAQAGLLKQQTDALPDGHNGKTELYGLLVAGWADQSVFLSEVEGTRGILAANYGAGTRSIILANSLVAPLRYPEVSWDNLIASTQALTAVMGDEDVLFFYLTSHGKADGFGLTFHPAAGNERTGMRARDLAELLDRYHPGPAVIVVSACKSGSFVDDFARLDRLVITASAADRNSFGCRDGAEWTRFGQYFLNVSLRADPDPRRAFIAALPMIEAAEWWQPWAPASEPQMSEGSEIGSILERLLLTRPAAGN